MSDPIGAAALREYVDYAVTKAGAKEGKTAISQKRLVVFTDETGKAQLASWDWAKKGFLEKLLAVLGIGGYSTDFSLIARTVKERASVQTSDFLPSDLGQFVHILKGYKERKEASFLSSIFHQQAIDPELIAAIENTVKEKVQAKALEILGKASKPAIQAVPLANDESFSSEYTKLFEKKQYKGKIVHWPLAWSWERFSVNASNSTSNLDVHGYENARRQWKVFLNPKKEYFIPALERVLQAVIDQNIAIEGKIIRSIDMPRVGSIPAGDDSCEPKIVIYFTEETSEKSQEKLRKFVEALEGAFTKEEFEEVGCKQGRRQIWVKNDEGQYEKKEIPQWGPSFTKQYNPLIYYTQGGFTESGRITFVDPVFDEAGMNEKFEGENFYRYKGEKDPFESPYIFQETPLMIPSDESSYIFQETPLVIPSDQELLDGAITRMAERKEDEQKSIESLKGSEYFLAMRMHRKEEASIESLTAKARIALAKNVVSDEKIAAVAGRSMTELRSMKIEQAAQFSQKSVFDERQTAQKLNISEQTLKEWLIESEKVFLLRKALTHFGVPFPHQLPPLAQLDRFLDELRAHTADFGKPFDIIKLYNLRQTIDSLGEAGEALVLKADAVIGEMIENMSRTRKSALLSLVEGANTPEKLREAVISKLFYIRSGYIADVKTTSPDVLAGTVEQQLKEILSQSKNMLQIVSQILLIGGTDDVLKQSYNEVKDQLSPSVKNYIDYCAQKGQISEALYNVVNKLSNICERQQYRLEVLKRGKAVQLPQFFHATNDEQTLFSITATGIRPSQASYYGAFVSTYPGMLRYGGVVIGLPERAAFPSDMGGSFGSPLVIPEHLGWWFNRTAFQDQAREKWIGFSQEIGISPYAHQAKEQFLELLSLALKTAYQGYCGKQKKEINLDEFAEVQAEVFSTLQTKNLQFSFSKEEKVWKPFVEEKVGNKSQYVLLGAGALMSMITAVDSTNAFKPESLLGVLAKYAPSLVAGDAIAVSAPTGPSLRPYYIHIDEDAVTKGYFSDTVVWRPGGAQNDARITPSASALKARYKEQIDYEVLKDRAESDKTAKEVLQEIDEFLETHFVPLLEQLIEFDCMSKTGALLRSDWLEK